MKRNCIRFQGRTGFSLIELIVVIVMIVILFALLLPVGRKAVESSRIADCTNRLRQLGIACLETALENNGALAWYEAPKNRNGMWWYKIHLRDNFSDFSKRMTCPSGKGVYRFAFSPQQRILQGTYRFNKRLGYQAPVGSWVYPLVRFSSISEPSRMAIVADNARMSDDTMGWEGTWAQVLESHQNQTVGLVFCMDGHIERLGLEYLDPNAYKKIVLNPTDLLKK